LIPTSEVHRRAASDGIRFDQAEKDYVILWILYALSQTEIHPSGWILKGGTCLRHCYYPGYRFSEDLDFTCQALREGLEEARLLLNRAVSWIQVTSGILMEIKFLNDYPGDFQVEIPIEYRRGGLRRQGLPCVKIHLTFDEPILTKTVRCLVKPQYSDLSDFYIPAYSKTEIIAEKMRALIQQQNRWPRPRDLFDLWFILCQSREHFSPEELRKLFSQKCQVRQIEPDTLGLVSENLREWIKGAWPHVMGALMKTVPEFEKVWHDWVETSRTIFSEWQRKR